MSEEAKHTPGPWRITYEAGPFELAVDSRIGLVVNPGGLAGETTQEYEANAHLIAAAPELLEALQNLTRCVDSHFGTALALRPARSAARKAIAKATGKEGV